MYMIKVGIHYPSLVRFFFSSNTREPRGPRTWIILKKCTCSEISVISLREGESFKRERESFKREGVSRERDESTQAEIRKGRVQAE